MKSNNSKKSILIISSSFTPSGHVGAKRFTFLSEILQKKYPKLHVLTRKEKYAKRIDDFQTAAGTIHRTKMWPPYPIEKNNIFKIIFNRLWVNYLCIIEPYSGLILPSLVKGLRIIKDNKIDLVIATCPLFSSMVVGYLLSTITGAKLILDYRDPWSNRDMVFCKIFGKRINRLFEKKAVSRASALVFSSPIMQEDFISYLSQYSNASYHTITNGFHETNEVSPLSLGNDRKNMVYAGNLYGDRKIRLLAKPLIQLLQEGVITMDSFCLHIFGNLNDDDRKVIKEYDLHNIIKEHSPVPYKEMLGYLKGADILLLLSGSDVRYAIPFKFFDYISVKRPILAISHENSGVQYMMNNIDCGRCCLMNSEESILTNLRSMLIEQNKYTFAGSEGYTWENIGFEYIKVIKEVLS